MTVLGGGAYILRPARPRDGKALKPRQCDIQEWDASIAGGVSLLPLNIHLSDEAWTIATKKAPWQPHMIFGVVTQGNPLPTTWLIGSDLAQRDAAWLLHECRQFMAEFFTRWPLSECFSDARNTEHHRWIKWLGYSLVTIKRMGPKTMPFHHYRKEP